MKAATAEAMQKRALGSMLLVPIPPLNSLAAAYPSNTVHWPEPKMETESGPYLSMDSLNFAAMRVIASSQDASTNLSALADQRLGEPVLAVEDLGEEISLDTVQPLVDRGRRVSLGGDDPAVLDPDKNTATDTAESGRGPCPM